MSVVADRALSLAVALVRERCDKAMRLERLEANFKPEGLLPMSQIHAGNLKILEAACITAQLELNEAVKSAKARSTAITQQRAATDE